MNTEEQYLWQMMFGGSGAYRVSPIFYMPLTTDLSIPIGTGPATLTRSTEGTYIDPADDLLKTAAINAARFEANGVLVEGASANLLLRSEDFSTTWGVFDAGSVTSNTDIAPDGALTADTITDSDVVNFMTIRQSGTVAADTNNKTFSVFIKKTSGATVFPAVSIIRPAASDATVIVNTNTGVITEESGKLPIASSVYEVNGYLRVSITQVNNSASSFSCRIFPAYSANGTSVGAGSLTNSIVCWGAQLEELAFASSYIKTVSATASRAADTLSVSAGNITAPSLNYSVSADVALAGNDLATAVKVFNVEGESVRDIRIDGSGLVLYRHQAPTLVSTTAVAVDVTSKITATVGTSNQALYINGVQESLAAKGVVTGTKTSISIGSGSGSDYLFGHIKNFRIYNAELTAEQVSRL